MKMLDTRGWDCPKPVLETKKALQANEELTVIVDNNAARANVSRLAEKSGYEAEIHVRDDGTYIHIKKGEGEPIQDKVADESEPDPSFACNTGKLVLFIASDKLGSGSDELGGILTRALMHTFLEVEPKPDAIVLMNSGVKLVVPESPVLDDLKALSAKNVEILVCGTCLNYFDLMEKVAVGEISNAYTIAETLLQAGKVIRL